MIARFIFIGVAIFTSGFGMVLMAYPQAAAPQPELRRVSMTVSRPGREETLIRPEVAVTLVEREIGLVGRGPGGEENGMFFSIPKTGGGTIATDGIASPVDLVVLDDAGFVLEIRKGVRPGEKVSYGPKAGAYLLMAKGSARKAGFGIGTVLKAVRAS